MHIKGSFYQTRVSDRALIKASGLNWGLRYTTRYGTTTMQFESGAQIRIGRFGLGAGRTRSEWEFLGLAGLDT